MTDLSDDRLLAYYAQEIATYKEILANEDAQLAELQAQRDANQRCLDSLEMAQSSLTRAREYDAKDWQHIGEVADELVARVEDHIEDVESFGPRYGRPSGPSLPEVQEMLYGPVTGDKVTIGEAAQKITDDIVIIDDPYRPTPAEPVIDPGPGKTVLFDENGEPIDARLEEPEDIK